MENRDYFLHKRKTMTDNEDNSEKVFNDESGHEKRESDIPSSNNQQNKRYGGNYRHNNNYR